MGERNRNGDVRGEYLRAGHVEQYAVVRSYGRVIVELRASKSDIYPWLVTLRIDNPKTQESSSADHAYRFLDDARHHFRSLIRKHP